MRRLKHIIWIGAASVLLVCFGQWLFWRWQVNTALEATITSGPDTQWESDPLSSESLDDYSALLSDHERVLNRLATLAGGADSDDRRTNALRAIRSLMSHAGSFEIRRQVLTKLIAHTCNSRHGDPVLAELTETIVRLVPATGVKQLSETIAGIDLLAAACEDTTLKSELDQLLTADSRQYLAAERLRLRNRNGDELWEHLIDGLDQDFWLPSDGAVHDDVESQFDAHRSQYSELSLD